MAGKNIFNSVKMFKPKKNFFDLSHEVKLTFNMGELIPIMCTEAVPGDKFYINNQSLIRLAPMIAPMMHRCDLYVHYFFVPHRILWPNWEKFITNTLVGGVLPAFPYIGMDVGTNDTYGPLADYFGIPTPIGNPSPIENVSALPFGAYVKIYNEYYRDQNLITALNDVLDDGNNTTNFDLTTLLMRCWEHDYFTSALPFAQKGAAVDLPLSFNDVPVRQNSQVAPNATDLQGVPADVTGVLAGVPDYGSLASSESLHAKTSLLSGTTTINDLRRATRLQEWLEKAARGGTRYVESILAHFGVHSSDKRLQRPEYITGIKTPVVISEVLQTGETASTPQGNMAGHGTAIANGKGGSYYCEEHGYIMGIMSMMPKTAYQQGIPKHFLKINDPFEQYFPSFANIGEQAVLNKEVYAFQGAPGADTFGYVPRYAEYKFEQNRVAGDFRNTLSFWTMARIFGSAPSLSAGFVTSDPTDRVFAVTDGSDHIWAHVYNQVKALRPMPKYGTPTF